jgi:hypothetical protein
VHGDVFFWCVSRILSKLQAFLWEKVSLAFFFGTIMLIIETKVTVNILGFILLRVSPPLSRLIIIIPKTDTSDRNGRHPKQADIHFWGVERSIRSELVPHYHCNIGVERKEEEVWQKGVYMTMTKEGQVFQFPGYHGQK